MNSEPINIENITPKELVIINDETPVKDTELQLNLHRKLEKIESGYSFYLSASIYKESEKDAEKKSFFIKYSLETCLSCEGDGMPAEDIRKEASITLYPYIRAGISAAMGAIGIRPLILPPYEIN